MTGLAVDGSGSAWFAEMESDLSQSRFNLSLGRYRAGRPIQLIALPAGAWPETFASAPDGSVWFADYALGQLGHISAAAVVTERSANAGTPYPHYLAVGPDGSVWYDRSNGIGRLRPNGTISTYDVDGNGAITVDSHGNAWMAAPMLGVIRVSDSGTATKFNVGPVMQLGEAADGKMWFIKLRGTAASQLVSIDQDGQTETFESANACVVGFPNSMVRGPDGALWFGTCDGRLIRLASKDDVTVYSLPWSDATVGPFVVLTGNRIVMLGTREVLDFIAQNATRVPGAQALPAPLPHIAESPAEGVAYAFARQEGGPGAAIGLEHAWEGDGAAAFEYGMGYIAGGYILFVYTVDDGGAWRVYDSFGTQNLMPPRPGLKDVLKLQSGCLNVHASPSKTSPVVACLNSGTEIEIDGLPSYADGYIWWHLVSRGWAAHPYLYCTVLGDNGRPSC